MEDKDRIGHQVGGDGVGIVGDSLFEAPDHNGSGLWIRDDLGSVWERVHSQTVAGAVTVEPCASL